MGEAASNRECPNCRILAKKLADLEARFAELEARFKANSSNSSKPPSSDPPWKATPPKPPSGKTPGGPPGHTGSFRQRLPTERINPIVDHIPDICGHCNASLVGQMGPHGPEVSWHQVAELPETAAIITEHRGHERRCACCGKTTRADIPASIRAHCTGPNMAAMVTYLTADLRVGTRGAQVAIEVIAGVPLSLGTVVALQAEASAALEAPYLEAIKAVRAAPVKNVDETGWAKKGKLCWLWLAATMTVAVFVIHAKRSKDGFKNLLGDAMKGMIGSDRFGVYKLIETLRRQLCWAHLKRDFQKHKDLGGEARKMGNAGLLAVKKLFGAWNEFKQGKLNRTELKARLEPMKIALRRALERGRDGPDENRASPRLGTRSRRTR